MATSSFLSNIQGFVSATPLFKGFSPLNNTSLFTRINCLFGLYAGGVTVYSLYHVYQAYRLRFHIHLGLDDRFKLVKCQAWLAQAKEQSPPNDQPLLQQCEAGLTSITDTGTEISANKEQLLLELIRHYAKENPDRSYQIATRLSLPSNLLAAAQCIHKESPSFKSDRLSMLVKQALDAKDKEVSGARSPLNFGLPFSSSDMHMISELTKDFSHSTRADLVLKVTRQVLLWTEKNATGLNLFRVLCNMIQYFHTIEDSDQVKCYIQSARSFVYDGGVVPAEAAKDRLKLAEVLFSCALYEEMEKDLQFVINLIEKNDPLNTIDNLYSLAKLVDKIKKDKSSPSTFTFFKVESFIKRAVKALDDLLAEPTTPANRAEDYLKIAKIYHEGFLEENTSIKTDLLEKVWQRIDELPKPSDGSATTIEAIHSQLSLLIRLSRFYEKDREKTQAIVKRLEDAYDQLPVTDQSSYTDLFTFGNEILGCYSNAGLEQEEEEETFLQKHIQNLQPRSDQDVGITITSLVTSALHLITEKQKKAFLQAAETLLPHITPSRLYKYLLAQIIEGYLKVDLKKGLTLLEDYENQQAKSYLIAAVVIPIIAWIGYSFPLGRPLFLLGTINWACIGV